MRKALAAIAIIGLLAFAGSQKRPAKITITYSIGEADTLNAALQTAWQVVEKSNLPYQEVKLLKGVIEKVATDLQEGYNRAAADTIKK